MGIYYPNSVNIQCSTASDPCGHIQGIFAKFREFLHPFFPYDLISRHEEGEWTERTRFVLFCFVLPFTFFSRVLHGKALKDETLDEGFPQFLFAVMC